MTSGHIVLIGEMGVGKTTIGRLLARALGRDFLDSDEWLEGSARHEGGWIASNAGVEVLHQAELGAFLEMASAEEAAVIAPAASVIDRIEGREMIQRQVSVWLTARRHALAERLANGGRHRRPTTTEERSVLLSRRTPFYEEVSDHLIDTTEKAPERAVDEIQALLRSNGGAG